VRGLGEGTLSIGLPRDFRASTEQCGCGDIEVMEGGIDPEALLPVI
jgi:hypothetical protein